MSLRSFNKALANLKPTVDALPPEGTRKPVRCPIFGKNPPPVFAPLPADMPPEMARALTKLRGAITNPPDLSDKFPFAGTPDQAAAPKTVLSRALSGIDGVKPPRPYPGPQSSLKGPPTGRTFSPAEIAEARREMREFAGRLKRGAKDLALDMGVNRGTLATFLAAVNKGYPRTVLEAWAAFVSQSSDTAA